MNKVKVLLFATAALFTGILPAAAAPALLPHRAVYEVSLAALGNDMGEGGAAMSGRMVYEFNGNACEGYTVNYRFVLQTADSDGQTTVNDMRMSTFEDGAGESFEFLSQNYTNQILTDETKGAATRADAAIAVDLAKPEDRSVTLPGGAVFPTAHLISVLEAAIAGERLVEAEVFDGQEPADRLFRTTSLIGVAKTAAPAAEEAQIGTSRRWPATVSYFDASKGGDLTPEYTVSFDLWDNGVTSDLVMDYGSFTLKGRLADFEVLPASACP